MDQYKTSDTIDTGTVKPVTKTPEQKTIESLQVSIKELNARIDTQYKLVDKLVRDIKRIKDQISVIAGKLPRG